MAEHLGLVTTTGRPNMYQPLQDNLSLGFNDSHLVRTGYPYAKRTDRLLTELHGQFMLAKLFMIDVQYAIVLHFLQNKPPMNNNTHKNIPPVYDPVTNRLDQFCTKEPPALSQ